MKPTVGILLDDKVFWGIPNKKTGYEKIGFYQKAARQLNLNPFFMSLRRSNKHWSMGYTLTPKGYRIAKLNIPKVIHNRAMTSNPKMRNTLKELSKSSIVFNRANRFSKYRINQLLAKHPSLRSYIPHTLKYSRQILIKAMKVYPSLYIKPTSGSVGDGIIKITGKSGGLWKIYWNNGKPIEKSEQNTVRFIEQIVAKHSYLIQKTIPLATFKGRPYDIRVSVQRDGTGRWQVTGMVGKVAAAGRHVTNVARGGKVRRCEELFRSSGFPVDRMKREIEIASLKIAEHLSRRLPHLADIGLDIGVDLNGRIKLIEMNGRDQRYSFRQAGMESTYFKTYYTPLQYAKRLLDHKT